MYLFVYIYTHIHIFIHMMIYVYKYLYIHDQTKWLKRGRMISLDAILGSHMTLATWTKLKVTDFARLVEQNQPADMLICMYSYIRYIYMILTDSIGMHVVSV